MSAVAEIVLPAAASELVRRSRRRGTLVLVGVAGLLALCLLVSVGVGALPLAPGEVLAILAHAVGLDVGVPFTPVEADVLLAIRLPRTLGGALVGAGLGVAGAVLQGLFRNPLADPGLIGLSSGAKLAASLFLVLGATPALSWAAHLGPAALPAFAVVGAWGAAWLVYRLGLRGGRVDVARMLLAGIALAVIAEALGGLLAFVAEDAQLRAVTMWRLGSLGGMTWTATGLLAAFTAVAFLPARRLAHTLNAMLLGERDASQLGVDVERTKRLAIGVATVAVGAGVAFAGVIGFVGLVVPHLVRMVAGPDHRVVIPGSALLGGAVLLGADAVARTLVAPAEVPLGVVTALLGAPFFLALLLRRDA